MKLYNRTNPLFVNSDSPLEGLKKINSILEFLVDLEEAGFDTNASVTSQQGVLLLVDIMNETLEQIVRSLNL